MKYRISIKIASFIMLFSYILPLFNITYAAGTTGTTGTAVSAGTNNTQTIKPFSDIPTGNAAYNAVNELRRLKITDGIGNNKFGYGMNITRGEFVTFLVRIMQWKQVTPAKASYKDNINKKTSYYSPVETALKNGALTIGNGMFRPTQPITREEAVVMVVKALGYTPLADQLNKYIDKPYPDINQNKGYITIAKDFNIISSTGKFNPGGKLLKQDAAVMLVSMLHLQDNHIKDLNGFYAINANPQKDKISDLTSVCFGWSRIDFDNKTGTIVLNTSQNANGYNDHYLPAGFSDRLEMAEKSGIPSLLMLYTTQDSVMTDPASGKKEGIPEYILTHPEVYRKLISDITSGSATSGAAISNITTSGAISPGEVTSGSVSSSAIFSGAITTGTDPSGAVSSGAITTGTATSGSITSGTASSGAITLTRGNETGEFDGVIVDIEGLRGKVLREAFNKFLKELKTALNKDGKKLYVAVHPLRHPKRDPISFDGYDYKTIGELADKVILMAHDYEAKKLTKADMDKGFALTPPTPLEDVYYALQQITNNKTGIQDKSKIMLQISFNWVWWQKKNNKILNSTSIKMGLEGFINILKDNKNIKYNYSKIYENPYITYVDTKTGIENIIWYENTTSVMEKIKLARFFGVQGISLWRLGNIPDVPASGNKYEMDIWQSILKEMENK